MRASTPTRPQALVGYLALGVCLLAVAVAGRRRGAGLPRWCGWIGGLGGGALVVSIGSLAAPAGPLGLCGFLGLILLVLWQLRAGGMLLARRP